MNNYVFEGLSSIERKLDEIETDLLTYKFHTMNLGDDLSSDILKMNLTDALNHLYIFEDEHLSLYRKDPECDMGYPFLMVNSWSDFRRCYCLKIT